MKTQNHMISDRIPAPGRKLQTDFYRENAVALAPRLLGKLLCRRLPDGTVLRARITETEAYFGESDTACHAHKGKTKRTAVLYEAGGISYVYLCYGIHNLLNVVTGQAGFPEAVLIRGIEGHNGPGKLTRAFSVSREQNGVDLSRSEELWLEEEPGAPSPAFGTGPRIGIGYAAEEDIRRPWRFFVVAW